jgi:hypothetical protein
MEIPGIPVAEDKKEPAIAVRTMAGCEVIQISFPDYL